MQAAADLSAVLQKAAQGPRLGGIYITSVALSAVHDWTHDVVLTIVWSMPHASAAIDTPGASLPGVRATSVSRPSDTCIVLARDLLSVDELETIMLQAAWETGAPELRRLERSPLPAGARSTRYGLDGDFGVNTHTIAGQPLSTGSCANDETLALAAQHGWVTLRFCPASLADARYLQRCMDADHGLQHDGSRPGVVGGARAQWYTPHEPGTGHEHIYDMIGAPSSARAGLARGGRISHAKRLARRAMERAARDAGDQT